jgi:hypothetical protein
MAASLSPQTAQTMRIWRRSLAKVLLVMPSSLLKMNQWHVDAEASCYVSHDIPANNPLMLLGYGLKVVWQVQFI